MDEPFSALDIRTREKLREFVKKVVKEYGATVLHVTHDLDDVWSLANKVMVMRDGEIEQFGSVEDVFCRSRSDFVAQFIGINVLEGVVTKHMNDLTMVDIGGIEIATKDRAEVGTRVRVLIRPEIISIRRASFSDRELNTFTGVIERIERSGTTVDIYVDIGGKKLRIVVTPNMLNELSIPVGDQMAVKIRPEDVVLKL